MDERDVGDVVALARVERIGEDRLEPDSGVSVTIDRKLLELHMATTRTCVVQMFVSTCVTSEFSGWTLGFGVKVFRDNANGLTFKSSRRVGASFEVRTYCRAIWRCNSV